MLITIHCQTESQPSIGAWRVTESSSNASSGVTALATNPKTS